MGTDAKHYVDAVLRSAAVLLGTVPPALLIGASAGRFLPLSEEARAALALSLVIPAWLCLVLFTLLARRASYAWLVLLSLTGVLYAVLLLL